MHTNRPATSSDEKEAPRGSNPNIATTVQDLFAHAKDSNEYDEDLYKKYGIKKYLFTDDQDRETEVWIYDEKSIHSPKYEDQALLAGDSLLAGARSYFNQLSALPPDKKDPSPEEQKLASEKREKQKILRDGFDKLLNEQEEKFKKAVKKLYAEPLNQRNYKLLCKELDKCIETLINNIAYTWKKTFHETQEVKDFTHFYKKFFKRVEKATPPHKKRNILFINTDPKVMRWKHVKRGIRQKGQLAFRSAHDRSESGVPNFNLITTAPIKSTGELDTEPTHMHSVARHASLAAIGLYKEEKEKLKEAEEIKKATLQNLSTSRLDKSRIKGIKEELQNANKEATYIIKGKYHAKCIQIAKENMESLLKVELKAPDQIKNTNWIKVSLLTVMDDEEKQKRQFEEEILAAELVRIKKPDLNPMTFTFGVNVAAQRGGTFLYPPEQAFENRRAFFQLIDLFSKHSELILKAKDSNIPKAATELLTEFERLKSFGSGDIVRKRIWENLQPLQQNYAEAYQKYIDNKEPDKNESLLKEMIDHETNLIKAKEKSHALVQQQFDQITDEFNKYSKTYENLLTQIKEELDKSPTPQTKTLFYALEDFFKTYQMLLNDQWYGNTNSDNNFKLQAHLLDLGEQLNRLALDYPQSDLGHTVASLHCKSGHDRSTSMEAHLAELQGKRDNPEFDMQANYYGGFDRIVTIDTNGGGPKYGFKGLGIINLETGHPDTNLAKKEIRTSKWATHKLEKEYSKFSESHTAIALKEYPSESSIENASKYASNSRHDSETKSSNSDRPITPSSAVGISDPQDSNISTISLSSDSNKPNSNPIDNDSAALKSMPLQGNVFNTSIQQKMANELNTRNDAGALNNYIQQIKNNFSENFKHYCNEEKLESPDARYQSTLESFKKLNKLIDDLIAFFPKYHAKPTAGQAVLGFFGKQQDLTPNQDKIKFLKSIIDTLKNETCKSDSTVPPENRYTALIDKLNTDSIELSRIEILKNRNPNSSDFIKDINKIIKKHSSSMEMTQSNEAIPISLIK